MPNQKSKHHDGVTSDLNQPAHSQKRHRKKSCTLPTPSFQTETYEAFPITFPTGLYCLMIPGVIKISNKLHITIHYTLQSLSCPYKSFHHKFNGEKSSIKKKKLDFFLIYFDYLTKKKNPYHSYIFILLLQINNENKQKHTLNI